MLRIWNISWTCTVLVAIACVVLTRLLGEQECCKPRGDCHPSGGLCYCLNWPTRQRLAFQPKMEFVFCLLSVCTTWVAHVVWHIHLPESDIVSIKPHHNLLFPLSATQRTSYRCRWGCLELLYLASSIPGLGEVVCPLSKVSFPAVHSPWALHLCSHMAAQTKVWGALSLLSLTPDPTVCSRGGYC